MVEKVSAQDNVAASLSMRSACEERIEARGYFTAVCYDRNGNIKWEEKIANLVTTVGKNDLLDKYFRGSSYTQTVRMGLKGAGSPAAGDTMGSHAGWSEVGGANAPAYSGNRKDVTLNAASGGSSASPSQAFVFTSSGTVAGCFMVNGGSATKDDTTGVLYSAGNFSASRSVENGDTLNVTYTATV